MSYYPLSFQLLRSSKVGQICINFFSSSKCLFLVKHGSHQNVRKALPSVDDFQENVKSAFGTLREDKDFADVTLACEDGQQMEAHKVILAASSPFFQRLLGRNRHPHPLIYMRGVKSLDMLAIIGFLYSGEADVYQENLDSFLAIAEEFQLKGLMGQTEINLEDSFENSNSVPKAKRPATHNIVNASRTKSDNKHMQNRRLVIVIMLSTRLVIVMMLSTR